MKKSVMRMPAAGRSFADERKWKLERQAFLRLRRTLLRSHRGRYVAIHEAKVVDSGVNKVALGLRVYAKFGYQPIYIGQVMAEPPPPARVPSPRLAGVKSGQ